MTQMGLRRFRDSIETIDREVDKWAPVDGGLR